MTDHDPTAHALRAARAERDAYSDTCDELHERLAVAQVDAETAHAAADAARALLAQATTAYEGERVEVARLRERAEKAERAASQLTALQAQTADDVIKLRAEVASYQAAAVGVADALDDNGGLGPVDDDQASRDAAFLRFAEGLAARAKKIRAEVAELRARPRMTETLLAAALVGSPDGSVTPAAAKHAAELMKLMAGADLMLPPASRVAAERIASAVVADHAAIRTGEWKALVDRVEAALAKLSPAPASEAPTLTAVSDEELGIAAMSLAFDAPATMWKKFDDRERADATAAGRAVLKAARMHTVTEERLAGAMLLAWPNVYNGGSKADHDAAKLLHRLRSAAQKGG